MSEKTDYSQVRLARSRAIRLKCLDCCCGSSHEVRICSIKTCALWRYRLGKELRDELYQLAHSTSKNGALYGGLEDSEAFDDELQGEDLGNDDV